MSALQSRSEQRVNGMNGRHEVRSRLKVLRSLIGGRERFLSKPKELFCDDDLRITRLGDTSAAGVFICFTGVKQALGGIGSEEFVGSTAVPGHSAIFVHDLQRSWYNRFSREKLIEILLPAVAGKRVTTIGNSMGGFGAILISSIIPVQTVIAFAPQFSVHPEIVPYEKRWREFTSEISHFRYASLAEAFANGANIYTINGDADEMHWLQFPQRSNCEHVLLDESGHEPAQVIKSAGILSSLIRECMRGGSALQTIRDAGLSARHVGS